MVKVFCKQRDPPNSIGVHPCEKVLLSLCFLGGDINLSNTVMGKLCSICTPVIQVIYKLSIFIVKTKSELFTGGYQRNSNVCFINTQSIQTKQQKAKHSLGESQIKEKQSKKSRK